MSKPTRSTKPAKPTRSTKQQPKGKKSNGSFIPEEVASAESLFFKPEEDESKIRIISNCEFGWVQWTDTEEGRRPERTSLNDGEPEAYDEDQKPKRFMMCAVVDRNDDDKIKIMELTQQSIIKAIRSLTENEDWGQPFGYDINITKKGEGLKTRYTVQPSPHKALSRDVIKAAQAKPCNLSNIWEDKSPWETEEGEETEYFFS